MGSRCSSAPETLVNVNGLGFSADPLPVSSWPGRDEMGDDTVLHILSICIFLTIGPFSLAFDCAIDFPSMAENEWGVRRRPQIT